jgi:predicted anti-sigma-YlaC factor YlaD
MYIAFALFLLFHGFAHLVGFAGPWGLAASLPPQATLLAGRISTGALAMRVLGVIWLGGALAFTLAAVGVLRHAAWWPSFTFGAAVASLLLCIISLPESKIGIPVNIAIISAVLLTHADVVTR